MKICWDNIKDLKLTKNGNLKKGGNTYVEKYSCSKCGKPYLTILSNPSDTCSKSCGLKDKPKSKDHIRKMRLVNLGRKDSEETKIKKSVATKGKNNPMYGRLQSQLVKDAISKANYRGGFTENKFASYDTYAEQIAYAEETQLKIVDGIRYVEVKCAYCGRWYIPRSFEVRARKNSLEGKRKGESLFYCTENCKDSCPTYHQKKHHRGFKNISSREVDPYTRKLCFERDGWQCQKCLADNNLHCHHIKGYAQNKMIANDIDNCITLCKECHKEIHKDIGCRFVDLQCKENK